MNKSKLLLFFCFFIMVVNIYGQKKVGMVLVYEYYYMNSLGSEKDYFESTGKNSTYGVEFFDGKYRVGVSMPMHYMWSVYSDRDEVVKRYKDYTSGIGLNANIRLLTMEKLHVCSNMEVGWEYNSVGNRDLNYTRLGGGVEFYPLNMASRHVFPYVAVGMKHYKSKMKNVSNGYENNMYFLSPYLNIGIVYRI